MYAETRADDLVIKCIRELLRRHPELPPERVDDVAIAATTQIGDQGLTIGRVAGLLAGLPKSVPGFAIDRMCAGAMTAVTTTASGHRLRRVRRGHRRRRRAHGPPPDGRGRRPQPADRRREAGRPLGPGHGLDGREPARPLPRADQGAGRRVRRGQPGQAGPGLRRRQDPARPGAGRDPQRGGRLGAGRHRRAAAPGHDGRRPGRAQDAVPPARPGHRRQQRRPQRRRHRLPAGLGRGRRRARPAGPDAAGRLRLRRASSRRSWARARSRPPSGPCPGPG